MTENEKDKTKKRKHCPVFTYGNYNRYYGYRVKNTSKDDPRFSVMKREWFENKECLDIGCNEGVITIDIARKFSCRSILGIDIDSKLVQMARRNLERMASKSGDIPVGSRTLVSDCANGRKTRIEETSASLENDLSQRVAFERENFIENLFPGREKYDTILCLSVTKWIHLNWGDEGLIILFSKIWRLLREGGILLLEPQPWKSYESNRLVSEVASSNFRAIRFTPDLFPDILLDKIGFRTMESITNSLPGTVAGFNRPIYIYTK